MNPKLQSLYGLKFHPFRPDVPIEALHATPKVDSFIRRVEISIADGGFVMITRDPGAAKSVALRLLSERLRQLRSGPDGAPSEVRTYGYDAEQSRVLEKTSAGGSTITFGDTFRRAVEPGAPARYAVRVPVIDGLLGATHRPGTATSQRGRSRRVHAVARVTMREPRLVPLGPSVSRGTIHAVAASTCLAEGARVR